jgi:uncharacterized protein (TIGR02466 family)
VNIHNLFPIPVAFFKFGRDLTEAELEFIKGQEHYANEGNTTSKDRKILKNKELTELRDFIEDSMLEYFKTVYAPKNEVSLYLTQSWANYTEVGQYHHKHTHPNSLVSGVFYPQADKSVDKIYFYKDGYENINIPPAEYNPYNSQSWWFEVGAGDLIFFPSSLTHMVQTKEGDNTRISIAFNTFLKGYIGSDESLTGLHLGEE